MLTEQLYEGERRGKGGREGEREEGGGGRGGGVQEVVNLKSEKQLQPAGCSVVLFTWRA